MTYELAKKLKDAGFPILTLEELQKKYDSKVNESLVFERTFMGNNTEDSLFLIPLLSELIEACGDGFINLVKGRIHKGKFTAQGFKNNNQIDLEENKKMLWFETPEEAVANLWLKLRQ